MLIWPRPSSIPPLPGGVGLASVNPIVVRYPGSEGGGMPKILENS
jgi:hypothetical protein